MIFQSRACFPCALFGTSLVLFESPNEKIARQEISSFENVGQHTGDYVGKKLETLPFLE